MLACYDALRAVFLIALGLSLLGGLGGLLVASGILLINDSARATADPVAGQLRRRRAARRVDARASCRKRSNSCRRRRCSRRCSAASCCSSSSRSWCSGAIATRMTARCTTAACFPVLVGDAFHNFVDGAVIAAAVMTSVPLGISTAVAVAAHEIPQEVGDFAILLHAGYSRGRALLLNVLSAAASARRRRRRVPRVRLRAAHAAVLPRARRRELPLRRDGRPDSRAAPRPHRRQLAAADPAHRRRRRARCSSCRRRPHLRTVRDQLDAARSLENSPEHIAQFCAGRLFDSSSVHG